jgi:hypothetical protein
MILFVKAFRSSDGAAWATLDEAQARELELLFPPEMGRAELLRGLREKSAQVVNILTTTTNSRPRARKANGASRTRKTGAIAPVPGTIGGAS